MAWVSFTADHDWSPTAAVTIAYLKGMRLPVTKACADRAVELGRAVRVATPKAVDREAFQILRPDLIEEP